MSNHPTKPASSLQAAIMPPLRNRGAQPGNLNALKHGRYLVGGGINRAVSIDPSHLSDLNELISTTKKFMHVVYSVGLQSTNLAEANETLRSLGVAGMGLARLINLQTRLTLFQASDATDPCAETND
jgi:hypothetical protein